MPKQGLDSHRETIQLRISACFLVSAFCVLLTGCSTSHIDTARVHYYQRDFEAAKTALTEVPVGDKNEVLALMEGGMISHTCGDYEASTEIWLTATEKIKSLDFVSVSEGASSLLINDNTQTYSGAPFERSLLHAFTAQNYFARELWQDAAVEARLITDGLASLNEFPDDPYSHYIAGLAFEMMRNSSGARIEYEKANELAQNLSIGEQSGSLAPASTNLTAATQPPPGNELICLISIGRAPVNGRYPRENRTWGPSPYAEILSDGKVLGRSYTLNTTAHLLAATQKRIAVIKTAKTATRIVLKESIASAVSDNNALLGEILRLILYALETPDLRGWSTLPMWLQVARVPCAEDLKECTVVFRNANGTELARQNLAAPKAHDNKRITLIRIW